MRILSFVALGALALALSTVGCSADAPEDGAAAASSDVTASREVVATEADEGKTVQVTEGDTFVLELASNATTGYAWKVTKTDRTFAYPFADTYEAPSAGGPVGAGGTQVLKWSTNAVTDALGTPLMSKVGKHIVTVEYRRPWESASTPAAKSVTLTVDVVAPASNGGDDGDNGGVENDGKCGGDVCRPGTSCQWCWGAPACVPNGAIC